MKDGIYYDLSDVDYFADRDSLSSSGMKNLLVSAKRFHFELDHHEDSAAFDVGHAAHAKVLGIGAPVVVIDVDSKRGKAWSEPADAARAEGRTPLTKPEAESVDLMAEAVLAHDAARRILTGGRSEVSAYWTDPEWNVQRRARFDHHVGRLIGDLKTTAGGLDNRSLQRTVLTYGYHLSAAQYLDVAAGCGLDVIAFALVFVEKKPPHDVRVVDLEDWYLDTGRNLCATALATYRHCLETGEWPGIDPTYSTLPAPSWA